MTTLEILTEVEAGRMSATEAWELLKPSKGVPNLEIGKVYTMRGEKDRFRYIGTKGADILFILLTDNYGNWLIRTDGVVPFNRMIAHKFIAS